MKRNLMDGCPCSRGYDETKTDRIMTKNDLLSAMRNEVFDTRFCMRDFVSYTFMSVKNCDEPFLWAVHPGGSLLRFIGPSFMTEVFSEEHLRMQIFRDNLAPISCITFDWGLSTKYFYWDGLSLARIQKDEARDIFLNLWSAEIKRQEILHKNEYDVCNQPLEIEIYGNLLGKDEALKKANELGDSSLTDCLDRITKRLRKAVDDKIELHPSFSDYSFTFCERVNGEPRSYGEIIYSENASDGKHWRIYV